MVDGTTLATYAGTQLALKKLRVFPDKRAQRGFVRDCDTLRQVVHENLVPFFGVVVDERGQPTHTAMQVRAVRACAAGGPASCSLCARCCARNGTDLCGLCPCAAPRRRHPE